MIINLLANILITFGITFFLFGVFKKKSKTIERLPTIEKVFLKSSLILITFGALSNIFVFSSPNISEIILNIGFGTLLVWAAFFHWKYFLKK